MLYKLCEIKQMIAADSTCSLMIKTSQEHTSELLAKKKKKNEQRKNVLFPVIFGNKKV